MFPYEQFQLSSRRHWQAAFIHENFPLLGYFAWSGFQHHGQGLLLCNIEQPPPSTELKLHCWQFTTKFLTMNCLADDLPRLGIPITEIAGLIKLIEQYNPQREIMLIMLSQTSLEVNHLQNLAISPLECYQQVQHRWVEFMLADTRSNHL